MISMHLRHLRWYVRFTCLFDGCVRACVYVCLCAYDARLCVWVFLFFLSLQLIFEIFTLM